MTVVTADHGEEFLEHGSMSHGYTLYEEQLRVPLILHAPGRLKPRRALGTVGLIDLAPTIAALAGIPDPLPHTQGRDRSALMRGLPDATAPVTFGEATYAKTTRTIRRAHGLKLIAQPEERTELIFDLGSDPGERAALGAHAAASELRRALEEWSAANGALHRRLHEGRTSEVVLDEETEERLRSLGYIR